MDNRIYNGASLLDIDNVWWGDDQKEYPYILLYKNKEGILKLIMSKDKARATVKGIIYYPSTSYKEYEYSPANNDRPGGWLLNDNINTVQDNFILPGIFWWTSEDIYSGKEVLYHHTFPEYVVKTLPEKTKQWLIGYLGYLASNIILIEEEN